MEGEVMENRVECRVYSCLYNQASNCHKGVIFVKMDKRKLLRPNTFCSSYYDKGFRTWNIEAAYDLSIDKYVYTGIACEVDKCVFNKYKRCEAEKVIIDSRSENNLDESHCHTFQPR